MTKELLVHFRQTYVAVLVPKKRGEGFLKIPLGHHNCPLSQVERDVGYDIFGLEGELEIQTGYISSEDYEELKENVIKPIAECLQLPYRVIDQDEYFAKHPIHSVIAKKSDL